MYITKNPFGELCEDCRVKQNLGRQGRLNKLDKEKSKYYDKIKKQVMHMQNFSCTLKFKVGKKIHHKITSKEAGSVHKKFILVGLTSPPPFPHFFLYASRRQQGSQLVVLSTLFLVTSFVMISAVCPLDQRQSSFTRATRMTLASLAAASGCSTHTLSRQRHSRLTQCSPS